MKLGNAPHSHGLQARMHRPHEKVRSLAAATCEIFAALGVLLILIGVVGIARADGLPDPTRPAFAVNNKPAAPGKAAPQAVRLTAIISRGATRVAILDGKVVQAGDRVADGDVSEILVDGVRIERAGHSELLKLPSQAIVVRAKPLADRVAKE